MSISGSNTQTLKTTSSSSSRTYLPSDPRTRVGRRRPRVETRDRLSRIGRGKAHALIGGKLIGGLAIVSRRRHRQLQKQRPGAQQMDGKHRGTGSAIGSQRSAERGKEREEGEELILQTEVEREGRRKRRGDFVESVGTIKEKRVMSIGDKVEEKEEMAPVDPKIKTETRRRKAAKQNGSYYITK